MKDSKNPYLMVLGSLNEIIHMRASVGYMAAAHCICALLSGTKDSLSAVEEGTDTCLFGEQ